MVVNVLIPFTKSHVENITCAEIISKIQMTQNISFKLPDGTGKRNHADIWLVLDEGVVSLHHKVAGRILNRVLHVVSQIRFYRQDKCRLFIRCCQQIFYFFAKKVDLEIRRTSQEKNLKKFPKNSLDSAHAARVQWGIPRGYPPPPPRGGGGEQRPCQKISQSEYISVNFCIL